jgi:hypothetical protein
MRSKAEIDVVRDDGCNISCAIDDVCGKTVVASIVIAGLFDARRINSLSSSAMTLGLRGKH